MSKLLRIRYQIEFPIDIYYPGICLDPPVAEDWWGVYTPQISLPAERTPFLYWEIPTHLILGFPGIAVVQRMRHPHTPRTTGIPMTQLRCKV